MSDQLEIFASQAIRAKDKSPAAGNGGGGSLPSGARPIGDVLQKMKTDNIVTFAKAAPDAWWRGCRWDD